MQSFHRAILVLFIFVGLAWVSTDSCQAFDMSHQTLSFSKQIQPKAEAFGWAGSFLEKNENRFSWGVFLVDCFLDEMSRLSLSISNSAWTKVGVSGQLNLARRVCLSLDCGMVLNPSFRHLLSTTAAAVAAITFYFE